MAITPAYIMSRSNSDSDASRVAPLSVHLKFCWRDSSNNYLGTTSDATSNPFHDLFFETSWGDSSSGIWIYGANAGSRKNYSIGGIAAHVYETPGTYTIVTRIYDSDGFIETVTNTITVTDPETIYGDSNTYYFSTGTDFTGCPGSAHQIGSITNWGSAVNTYKAAGRRLLFKRGDTFNSTTTAQLNVISPITVGAWGQGTRPVVNITNVSNLVSLGMNYQPDTKYDWRLMDLNSNNNSNGGMGIEAANNFNFLTVLRVDVQNAVQCVSIPGSPLASSNRQNGDQMGHYTHNYHLYQDCYLYNGSDYGVFAAVRNSAFLGCFIDRSLQEHTFRISFGGESGLVSNCSLSRPSDGTGRHKQNLKLCGQNGTSGPDGTLGNGYTEFFIVSDNKYDNSTTRWGLTTGAQNATSDERCRDVIFERNWLIAGAQTGNHILNQAVRSTLRNNLFVMTGGYGERNGIRVFWWANPSPGRAAPAPDYYWIYNNTFFSSGAGTIAPIMIEDVADHVTIKNNLAYTPDEAGAMKMIGWFTTTSGNDSPAADDSSPNCVHTNNSSNTDIHSTNPLFAGTTNPVDFRIATNSPYLDNGADVFPSMTHDFYNGKDKNSTPKHRRGAFVPKAYARCSGAK